MASLRVMIGVTQYKLGFRFCGSGIVISCEVWASRRSKCRVENDVLRAANTRVALALLLDRPWTGNQRTKNCPSLRIFYTGGRRFRSPMTGGTIAPCVMILLSQQAFDDSDSSQNE